MASQKKRWRRRQLATNSGEYPLTQSLRVWINYHPYTTARLWNRASQAAQRLESHPRFTLVRFEDLLENPDSVIRSLCSDLDVEYEQSLLEVGQINSSHKSSVGGARKGLHKDAIDTWKSTLSGGETAIAERQCRQLMKHYGYTPLQKKHHSRREELPYIFSYLLHALGVLIVNPRRAWIQFQAMPASLRMQKLRRNKPAENRTGSDSRPADKEQE